MKTVDAETPSYWPSDEETAELNAALAEIAMARDSIERVARRAYEAIVPMYEKRVAASKAGLLDGAIATVDDGENIFNHQWRVGRAIEDVALELMSFFAPAAREKPEPDVSWYDASKDPEWAYFDEIEAKSKAEREQLDESEAMRQAEAEQDRAEAEAETEGRDPRWAGTFPWAVRENLPDWVVDYWMAHVHEHPTPQEEVDALPRLDDDVNVTFGDMTTKIRDDAAVIEPMVRDLATRARANNGALSLAMRTAEMGEDDRKKMLAGIDYYAAQDLLDLMAGHLAQVEWSNPTPVRYLELCEKYGIDPVPAPKRISEPPAEPELSAYAETLEEFKAKIPATGGIGLDFTLSPEMERVRDGFAALEYRGTELYPELAAIASEFKRLEIILEREMIDTTERMGLRETGDDGEAIEAVETLVNRAVGFQACHDSLSLMWDIAADFERNPITHALREL